MSSAVRSWRTAFLTLRDETLASPPPATILHLLNQLILSQSESLVAAAPNLPPHEVTSDLMLLVELARDMSHSNTEDTSQSFIKLSHMVHDICHCSCLEINSTSWAHMLESLERIVHSLLGKVNTNSMLIRNNIAEATKLCLKILRSIFSLCHTSNSLVENEKLLNLVLQVVKYFHEESIDSSYLSYNFTISGGVWEVLTIAFGLIGEVYLKVGSSLSSGIWKSMLEVLRKVIDLCASGSVLLEDNNIAMFYIELLHCLHLVLAKPRGYLAQNVAGFVASLRTFFIYGLVNKSPMTNGPINFKKEISLMSPQQTSKSSNRSKGGPYRPPHLRKKVIGNQQHKIEECVISTRVEYITSDSDCSDSDGLPIDNCAALFAEARFAAILCIQDLCRADPKLFTSQWTMLLPSTDVLHHRKYETTLMSCLLYDPYSKVRIVAGSTILVMLDGPASVSLQVAELREHPKCGSFTAFSVTLGHILVQLHSGTLFLMKRETNRRLLALVFKIMVLLISSTPYSRMSPELLPMIILSVQSSIEDGFSFQSDQNCLLVSAINCLTLALSVFPPSARVTSMLLAELSEGSPEGHRQSGVLYTLFRYAEKLSSPSLSLEAFQALKALAHNYPNVISLCWEQVSSVTYVSFNSFLDAHPTSWRGNSEHTITSMRERVMTAAIKFLDECLRAISGFKGTEDIANDKFLESPFTSDYVKTKTISSAPSYGLESSVSTQYESETCLLASEKWLDTMVELMPIVIKHSSSMVRAAAVTCFAGMTSSVFYSLPKDKQEFLISSIIIASINDEVPSVRSAACRAIGVIACFPRIYDRREVLENFIQAIEHNAFDSLISVRVTASWALANICDSISHYVEALDAGRDSADSEKIWGFISLLFGCALHLARDNDKVKANAVRALGNLSRFIQFTSQPLAHGNPVDFMHCKIERTGTKVYKDDMRESSNSSPTISYGTFDWLEQMVQAFISCMTTGNVKVQWNVCHAVSNLFLNKTLKLQDMDWAESVFRILVLLLRDSSNFKIRIQAAAAIAVPGTINDYGKAYYDVVKTVQHVVENFKSDQISEPSNFKYLIALEKQLTSTMLHLLGLASECDDQALQDFLIKKGAFLEVWLEELWSSVSDKVGRDQKKDVIMRTIQSLIKVFERSNEELLVHSFHRLEESLAKGI